MLKHIQLSSFLKKAEKIRYHYVSISHKGREKSFRFFTSFFGKL